MLTKYLDPKNDVAFKKIFGSEKHKDILIHFINDMLGYIGEKAIIEVEFLNTIQDPEIASKKQSIVDVLCKDSRGVQYIIEMQVAESKGFEKRAQYYAAKAYCSQVDKGDGEKGKYANLKEIIFIAIADFVLFPEKEEYKSDHVILDKLNGDHNLKDFSFTFVELPKFTKKMGDKLENMVEKWCVFFKYADEMTDSDLQKLIEGGDIAIKDAYVALDRFNWSEEELRAYEQELKRIWDNAAVEEAKQDAFDAKLKAIDAQLTAIDAQLTDIKAKAEVAEAKGREEGKKARDVEIAKNLLLAGVKLSIIASTTGLSESEIENLNNSDQSSL